MADVAIALDPRLNVFTGDNGIGKSLILDVAFWAECGMWPRLRAVPDPARRKNAAIRWSVAGADGETAEREARYDTEAERWRRKTVAGDKPERRPVMIYAMVDGGFAVFDQARAGGRLHEDDADAQVPMASRGRGYYVFDSAEVFDGLGSANGHASNGLVRDWPDWQYRHKKRFRALQGALRTLSEGIGEPIQPARPRRVASDDAREIPWIKLPYGEIPIVLASAAMRRVAALAYMLVWAWAEHEEACRLTRLPRSRQLVLLFDEVECHLHPRWQRAILPALLSAAAALTGKVETQILATTHSPLVLASLEPIFEEARDQLHLMELNEKKSAVVRPIPFVRMGRADTWLVSESFGLAQPMSAPAEDVTRAIHDLLARGRAATTGDIDKVRRRTVGLFADTDPLLAQLDFFARSRSAPAPRGRGGRRK